MITEHRKKIKELIGDRHSHELREILEAILIKKWDLPQHRFSPLMIEHLLYFITKSIPIINSDLFVKLLTMKFAQEYGYEQYPHILPKLVDDLIATLRPYCTTTFQLHKKAPQKAIADVFTEPLMLFLDGYKISSKSAESIWDISGLPLVFLSEFFECFSQVLNGDPITDEMDHYFGPLFRFISHECSSNRLHSC
ncbi:hypothetical protein JXQ70_15675 [bacterium]|nr:hypothetical protein [bacterium]